MKYNIGDFLYKIPSNEESEAYNPIGERVFVFNGCINGDGYGMTIGWNDGKIKKSTGFKNFMWSGEVRKATDEEIHEFMAKLMNQDIIKPY